MKQKNYYEILGVSENATEAEIKKVFRTLAKECHPDRNPGKPAAEARFKEINEAYEVLGDAEKRKKYDQLRRYSAHGAPGDSMSYEDFVRNFGGQSGSGGEREFTWGFDTGSLGDIFSSLFGGSTREQTPRSPFTREFRTRSTSRPAASREPRATDDPFFKRKGNDAYVDVPINLGQALLGSKIRVRTPSGQSVVVRIPAGIKPEATLRVRGMGYQSGPAAGDLFIRTHLALPESLTAEQRELVEKLARSLGLKH